uniref:Uncharacterized protein n=1 Tax=Oryza glumipatula TaxID=40148 RepID=A0A0E0BJA1_9ORYZ
MASFDEDAGSSYKLTIDTAGGVIIVVVSEMEVGPGCTCIVIIVERLVSEPADRATLRRRRAPCLRTGRPGCACVIIVEPLVSEPAGQAVASSSSSSASSQNRRAGLRLRHRRRAPRLGAGGPGCAASAGGPGCTCIIVVDPLVSEPAGRAVPASSSSAPPARSPATAPMPIATLPTTTSPSPTLAAAATDLLPPCRSSR